MPVIYEKNSIISSNDIVEPVTFPMGPISTPAERNLLLSQRAEKVNNQLIVDKCQKRRKPSSTKPKKTGICASSPSKMNLGTVKKTTKSRKRKISSFDTSSENDSLADELSSSSSEEKSSNRDNIKEKDSNPDDSSSAGSSGEDSEYEMDKFIYLTNKLHYDEEDKSIYKTTRVVEENGFIVAYRKKKYPNGKFASREDRNPIYAKDVVEYTKAYDNMQKK